MLLVLFAAKYSVPKKHLNICLENLYVTYVWLLSNRDKGLPVCQVL